MIDGNHRKNEIIRLIKECITSMRVRNGQIVINEDEFADVREFVPIVKSLCNFLVESNFEEVYCEKINDTNNIVIYNGDSDCLGTLYNIICSDSMTFSGTIGVRQIEKDGGISAHLNYLSLFLEPRGLDFLENNFNVKKDFPRTENDVIDVYMNLYKVLRRYFETFPMAMYSLMTGIKRVYSLPNSGIIINPTNFEIVDFKNFKNVNLINFSHESFTYELSKNTPHLKICFEGIKLMNLRTKIDYKSKKFRLRFMMETGKNFFKIFEKLSEI